MSRTSWHFPFIFLVGVVSVARAEWNLQWTRQLPARKPAWRFHTNGPVRFAPAADTERIYVGSDDGHLYCLDHDGRGRWKVRGGPSPRKLIGHERLISVWPLSARPALRDGRIYFVAGYWPIEGCASSRALRSPASSTSRCRRRRARRSSAAWRSSANERNGRMSPLDSQADLRCEETMRSVKESAELSSFG